MSCDASRNQNYKIMFQLASVVFVPKTRIYHYFVSEVWREKTYASKRADCNQFFRNYFFICTLVVCSKKLNLIFGSQSLSKEKIYKSQCNQHVLNKFQFFFQIFCQNCSKKSILIVRTKKEVVYESVFKKMGRIKFFG